MTIGLMIAVLSTVWTDARPVDGAGRRTFRPARSSAVPSAGSQHSPDIAVGTQQDSDAEASPTSGSTAVVKLETAGAAGAACCDNGSCPDDEPWLRGDDQAYLVDTRCLAWPDSKQVPELPVYRYDALSAAWQPVSTTDLADACLGAIASIHVHGNRISRYESVARGWAAYHELVNRNPAAARLVFIIWSWPSDQIHGQLKDVRVKAARTTAESFFLAHLISELHPETPISLAGHSFGARIICGGAHLVAGGRLGAFHLAAGRAAAPRQMNAVLTAAAMHDCWLSPGCYHGQALQEIDRLLVLYNPCDPVLKYYRHIEKRARPRALGYTGAVICGDTPAEVEQINVACQIGKRHSFFAYLCNPTVADLVAPYVLFQTDGDVVPMTEVAARPE